MDDWELNIYVQEVINQCVTFEISMSNFNLALQAPSPDSVSLAFENAQSLLAAAAMISKLLWPNPSSHDREGHRLCGEAEQRRLRTVKRGKELRKVLIEKTDNAQPLKDNRTVRNAFEHFDERLDDFVYKESEGARNIIDRNIVPLGMIVINGDEPKHLRRIDPEIVSISVLESSVHLQPLADLIQSIKARAILWQDGYRASH
jgi:hypothetical protein